MATPKPAPAPKAFRTPAAFRAWLERHHATAKELEARRSGVYSFEQERPGLSPAYLKAIRANKAAWTFFQAQAPGFRRLMAHWVMSAKREETRAKRLGVLIDSAARGRKVPPLEALERPAAAGRKAT